MLRVNGLYGHIQRNNAKAAILIVAFVALFMCMQAAFRVIPYLIAANFSGEAFDPEAMDKELAEVSKSVPVGLGPFATPQGTFKISSQKRNAVDAEVSKNEQREGREQRKLRKTGPPPSFFRTIIGAFRAQHFFDAQARFLLVFAAIHLIIATWWNSLFIRYATRAKSVSRKEFPELYDVVENLAISVGLPCPSIEIVDSPKLNAYASGLTPTSARLGLTTGLIQKLTRAELEAVVAHELTHIRQGDSRLMAILKACVDLVLPQSGKFVHKLKSEPQTAIPIGVIFVFVGWKFALILAAIVGVLTLATYAAKAMVLHAREFVADAGAVELTKNPAALISALCKIAVDDDLPVHNAATQAMMFSGSAGGLFSTHPTVEERIAAIQAYGAVSAADVTAERARGLRAVSRPAADNTRQPSFGRRATGVRCEPANRVAARRHAVVSEPQAVWREQAVFEPFRGAQDTAPAGDSLFERWIMTGRLERTTDKVKHVARAPFRLLFKLQLAVCAFGFVMTALMHFVS